MKITDLPRTTSLKSDDVFVVSNTSDGTRKISINNLYSSHRINLNGDNNRIVISMNGTGMYVISVSIYSGYDAPISNNPSLTLGAAGPYLTPKGDLLPTVATYASVSPTDHRLVRVSINTSGDITVRSIGTNNEVPAGWSSLYATLVGFYET